MLEMTTVVPVKGITGKAVIDFFISCTDQKYQHWWPGTHFAFHTLQRTPNEIGNLVYFDEMVGTRRLKFKGVVIEYIPGYKIVWQMKKRFRLPAWLVLETAQTPDGVTITHTLKAGFKGIGTILDPLLRLYLSSKFQQDLEDHANYEFNRLADILN